VRCRAAIPFAKRCQCRDDQREHDRRSYRPPLTVSRMKVEEIREQQEYGLTYKQAGVNIDAGEELVRRIKPMVRQTFSDRVLTDIGGFGGLFDARFPEMKSPVLVSSTDGVGTKIKIAIEANRHDTVGQDLVNHCVNDILVC